MANNTSVMGIYPDRTTVSDAISVLHKTGYRATDISVLASDNVGSKDFGHERRTKGAMGAALGAAVGAAAGASLACLVALRIVPAAGLDQLVAAGPSLAGIAGAGAGGAVGWLGGLVAGMRVTFGDIYIFEAWKMNDEPAILIGMDVIGLLDSLILDYKRKDLHLRPRH